jgi:hypothetical protein
MTLRLTFLKGIFMKTLFLLASLSLIVPNLAFAKITRYSNSQAVKMVMESDKLSKLQTTYGTLTGLTVVERNDSNALQSFDLLLTLTLPTAVGPRKCTVAVDVFVDVDKAAPAGITASKMLAPGFHTPDCEE